MKNRPTIRWGWVRALLFGPSWLIAQVSFGLTVYFVLVALAEFFGIGKGLSGAVFNFDGSSEYVSSTSMFISQVLEVSGTVFAVVMLRRLMDGRTVKSLGLKLGGWVWHLAAGAITGSVAIAVGFLVLKVSGVLTVVPNEFGVPWVDILVSLCLFALVSINEELIVRGYLLANICASMNRYVAVAITSAIFGALHLFNFNLSVLGIINIALAGVVMGLYYARFGNLWFPIGLHLTWNFFQGPIFGFGVSGFQSDSLITHTVEGPNWLTGGQFGLEGSVIATALEVMMIVGILFLGRVSPKPTPDFASKLV